MEKINNPEHVQEQDRLFSPEMGHSPGEMPHTEPPPDYLPQVSSLEESPIQLKQGEAPPPFQLKAEDEQEGEKEEKGGFWSKLLDGVQTGLDVAGLIPGVGEIADLANAAIYTARGDYLNAGLSAAAAIPFAGWAATGGKLLNRGLKVADTSGDVIKGLENSKSFFTKQKKARTWNEFQQQTKGNFNSRGEAGEAWQHYKKANDIKTGTKRSQAQKRKYLQQIQKENKHPKWMNNWLKKGKVPPGHEVDHIKPLSIGGKDLPENMRLQEEALHDLHHKHYAPWRPGNRFFKESS